MIRWYFGGEKRRAKQLRRGRIHSSFRQRSIKQGNKTKYEIDEAATGNSG